MPFNFTLLNVPWSAEAVRSTVDAMEAALPPGAWPNWVLGNHDESRIASRIGAAAARSAMLFLLTLRGTPTLYYGDELGMEDVPVPPELVQDPWGKNVPGLGLGRDPERAPMPWDGSSNAGFTRKGVRPWLPLPPDAASRNVAAQAASPDSMLPSHGRSSRCDAHTRPFSAEHTGPWRTRPRACSPFGESSAATASLSW
jgi:alpha-glucosidase